MHRRKTAAETQNRRQKVCTNFLHTKFVFDTSIFCNIYEKFLSYFLRFIKIGAYLVHFALLDFSEILMAIPFKRHFAESQSCIGRSYPYEFGFFPRCSCLMRSDPRQVRQVFQIACRGASQTQALKSSFPGEIVLSWSLH